MEKSVLNSVSTEKQNEEKLDFFYIGYFFKNEPILRGFSSHKEEMEDAIKEFREKFPTAKIIYCVNKSI